MESFDLSCSLTGINITVGDEVLLVVLNKERTTYELLQDLYKYIDTTADNERINSIIERAKELAPDSLIEECITNSPITLMEYGEYNDYGYIDEYDTNLSSNTYLFKKEAVDFIIRKFSLGNHCRGELLLKIVTFAYIARKELQPVSLFLGKQSLEPIEVEYQSDLLILQTGILRDKINKELEYYQTPELKATIGDDINWSMTTTDLQDLVELWNYLRDNY